MTTPRIVCVLAPAALLTILTGCRGKPLAVADLPTAGGSTEVHLRSTGKPVALWSDTNGKWTGGANLPVTYQVEFVVNGSTIGRIACESASASTRVCAQKSNIGSSHSGNCEVKMGCAAPALPAGDVLVKVTARPALVVTELTHLALVVRDE
jgi:hypothetical protein